MEYELDPEAGVARFQRAWSLHDAKGALGVRGGHVEALPDGSWLVSWGFDTGGSIPVVGATVRWPVVQDAPPPPALATMVDPATGGERLVIPRHESEVLYERRVLPVAPAWLERAAAPLAAVFPDGAPAAHGGKAFTMTVAFTQPVAAFSPSTSSLEVEGGRLVAVAPEVARGRPASSWRLTLAPDGQGPLRLSLRSGVACATGGICAAPASPLVATPLSVRVPFAASD